MKMSKVDNIIARIKNNKILAFIIAIGIIVIALSTFTGALKNLLKTIGELAGPASPVNISGKWKAVENEKNRFIYFDFKVMDNKLYGKVLIYNFICGISDGYIAGNHVEFTTEKDVDSDTDIVYYDGEISEDGIHLSRSTKSGYYTEMIAKKIIDLTEVSISRETLDNKNNIPSLVCILSGHDGGIQSLSFSPFQGGLLHNRLILTSGGAKDGKIKYWDIADKKCFDSRDLKTTKNGGSINLVYNPEIINGIVDLTTVGLSKDRTQATFYDLFDKENGSSGGGGSYEYYTKAVGPVTISGDSRIIAITENESNSKIKIAIRYADGNLKDTIICKNKIDALALSSNGDLLVSAETMESKEKVLKLRNLANNMVIWSVSSELSVNHIAFSSNDSMLAFSGFNDDKIKIQDAKTSSIKYTLLHGQDKGISAMAFSTNGMLLATAGFPSGTIKLWNTYTGNLIHIIKNEEPVGALVFSHESYLLAAGDIDRGSIKIWANPILE